MTTAPVLVFGAGGHGRVVADVVLACGWELRGFLDDDHEKQATIVSGVRTFAADEWLRSGVPCRIALGIGDNRVRQTVAERLRNSAATLVSVIHPSAVVSRSARVQQGVVVMPGAVVNAESNVGGGAIINTGAIIEHHVEVGRYAHMSSNCTAGGGAKIGDRTLIGVAAAVLPGTRVGSDCIIGAGAVVTRHIEDFEMAYGVPAKVQRRNSPGVSRH